MQMDWSAGWLDELQGETHLLIPPNSEHSLATGIPEVIDSLSAFLAKLLNELFEGVAPLEAFEDGTAVLLPSAVITDCKSLFDQGESITLAAAGGRDREASVDLLMLCLKDY